MLPNVNIELYKNRLSRFGGFEHPDIEEYYNTKQYKTIQVWYIEARYTHISVCSNVFVCISTYKILRGLFYICTETFSSWCQCQELKLHV